MRVDNTGLLVVRPADIQAVPVVEEVGKRAVAGVGVRFPPVVVGAGAGVWREWAASEDSEVVLLVWRGRP